MIEQLRPTQLSVEKTRPESNGEYLSVKEALFLQQPLESFLSSSDQLIDLRFDLVPKISLVLSNRALVYEQKYLRSA